jgi:hypothetical protein
VLEICSIWDMWCVWRGCNWYQTIRAAVLKYIIARINAVPRDKWFYFASHWFGVDIYRGYFLLFIVLPGI